MRNAVAFALVACAAMGCAASAAPESAPTVDASAAHLDAAVPVPDAGGVPAEDATSDAPPDATPDPVDASPPPIPGRLVIACTDSVADVYTLPQGLPGMDPSHRGDVVRCASDVTFTSSDIAQRLAGKSIAITPTGGASLYRVAFRTERATGGDGISAARVYLPSVPRGTPLPVIVAAHPTVGLAAGCTPSQDATSLEDLALPWVALGYAVIAPDYAGLGTPGVQGYVDNRDTAYSTLDGARALRKLMTEGSFDERILLVGYSQGGGAVLSAQALASTYGAGGRLVGVVAFAPEWATRLNSFGAVAMLRTPEALTISTGISDSVVMVLRQYAYFANYIGIDHAADSFPSAKRAGIQNAVQTLCQTPLGGYLQANETHLGDLVDPAIRTALLACVDSSGAGAGCVEPAKSFYGFQMKNFVVADANGAPVLFVQGLLDEIMPAAREGACNVDKLRADGVTPQVCVDLAADHLSVVQRNVAFAVQWSQAILDGTTPPACSAFGLPACAP